MSEPRTRSEGAGEDEEPSGLADLETAGDVEGLLALARELRSGARPGGRDLARSFEAYGAAARLGDADAEYAVALFLVNGGPVPQDLKEGSTRLRVAAERGSVPAKVFLGNMYELGVHYKADPEKADVWYRNAARSAGVEAAPGTDAHTRALAELGCVRYVLAVVERGGVDEATRTRLLARARAHGHGLRTRPEAPDGGATPAARAGSAREREEEPDRASFLGALESAAPSAPAPRAAAAPPGAKPKGAGRAKAQPTSGARTADALAAFGYALLFLLASVGAAYAAFHGARELVAHGTKLPLFGSRADAAAGAVLAAVGVLPALLVYRLGTVAKALVAAGVMGAVGWVSWGTGQAVLHAAREVQTLGFALPGFAAALLVLGLVEGPKLGARRRRAP